MPTTDTLFQIIDRMSIAQLKAYHFEKAGNTDAAKLAQEQADDLRTAGDIYLYECLRGIRKPMVRPHLRFHDHGKAEGWRSGKDALEGMTDQSSLMETAAVLAKTHAVHWSHQTHIQWLKERIRTEGESGPDRQRYESDFVATQRQIDLCNQHRNELIQHGDELFAKMLEGTR